VRIIVTIRDVAKIAGVSISTVSHVINKTRYVSPELRKKVNDIMKKLDYEPNLLASSLKTKKTGTIGLVISDSSNLFFAFMQTYIENIFTSQGFSLIVSNSHYDLEKEIEVLKMMRSKRVDGILIVPENIDSRQMESIDRSGIPIVIIEREIQGAKLDSVLIDNRIGSFNATEYLIGLGHRRIGYLDRMVDKSHSIERKKGYLSALRKNNIEIREELIIRSGFSCEDGYKATKYLINLKESASAILTFGDFAALGSIKYIYDKGLSVPDDISIIGFTDMPICDYTRPSLTTIKYPVSEIAKASSNILLSRIKEPNGFHKKKIILKPKLIIRESTAKRK
jgi:DNA-binding LacI/PurR family transcriptional regulator